MSGAKPFSRVKIALIAVLCLVLAVVVMLLVLFRGGQPGSTVSIAPAAATIPPSSDAAPVSSAAEPQSDVPGALEQAVAEAARDADTEVSRVSPSKEVERLLAIQRALWQREDDTIASVPKYREVKEQYAGKAEALLARANAADPKTVQALADAELALFWEKGGLVNPESLEHAYLARAILEIACQQSPEDFQLLSSLKEAMSVAMPKHLADFTPLAQNVDELWAVTQRQKELIDAGKVPPSTDAMIAMNDWLEIATLHKKLGRATVRPVCQWLVDNADAGGWSKLKPRFAVGLDDSRPLDTCYYPQLYVFPVSDTNLENDIITQARSFRRLPSFRGSPEFRAAAFPHWENWESRLNNSTFRGWVDAP